MTKEAHINVAAANLSDKSLIQNLMQLYLYDFSEFNGYDLNEHGLYNNTYVDHYWVEKERKPFIIRVEDRLAGFVLINNITYIVDDGFAIADFFVMRKYRRRGVGRAVARRIFDMFGPNWEIRQTKDNHVAQAFWIKIIQEYTNGDFEHYQKGKSDWDGAIQTFRKR